MKPIVKAFYIWMIVFLLAGSCASSETMPVVTDVPYTEPELQQIEAERAERLRQAQQMLIDLGYLTGAADGIYGPRTASALSAFQQSRGLETTGELDDATYEALTDMAQTVAEARELQERLIELNYLRGVADGIFGERSQAALRRFQALNGLEATGKLDDATRELLFSRDQQPLPQGLSGGNKGERVEALQQELIRLGFLNGSADGSYGKNTTAAVKRFQNHLIAQGVDEALGIEPTGEATSVTLALLYDPGYSSYIMDLASGDEGDEVSRVERRLVTLGYMDMDADDSFDDYAVRAARVFQAAVGQGAGPFGQEFIDALFSGDAPVAENFVPHDIALGDRCRAVTAAQEALVRGGMAIAMPDGRYGDGLQKGIELLYAYLTEHGDAEAELFADPAALSVAAQQALQRELLSYVEDVGEDSEGEETMRVQRRLHTLYYLSKYNVDGKYGEGTRDALLAFQEANGLEVTGVADEATQRRMFSTEAVYKQLPYRVEVDIDHQRVYVFQLNEAGAYEQVQTFVCSTGMGNATPRGIFLDGFPVNVWHHFEKFDCWARYSFEIEGNIMFHSVLYSDKDESTLREGSLYALGSKASHGCIRLRVSDARWLFENCKRGSLVILIY